jgi:hypothetical protein
MTSRGRADPHQISRMFTSPLPDQAARYFRLRRSAAKLPIAGYHQAITASPGLKA